MTSMEMFGSVFVLGRVAAADVSTFEANTQVYPRISYFQTILAPIRAGRDVSYRIKMCALFCHRNFLERFNGKGVMDYTLLYS